MLNVFLSVYVTEITRMGNGCSWYLIQLMMDLTVGVTLNYALFKIVDNVAITFGIEVSSRTISTNSSFFRFLKVVFTPMSTSHSLMRM